MGFLSLSPVVVGFVRDSLEERYYTHFCWRVGYRLFGFLNVDGTSLVLFVLRRCTAGTFEVNL